MGGTEEQDRAGRPAEPSGLIARAVAGDEAALVALLERHGPALRARVAADLPIRWQSVLSVEDVLQQAYTDAFLAIRRFVPQGEAAFAGWLFRLARNAMLDAIDMLQAVKRGGDRRQIQADPDRSLAGLFDAVLAVSVTPSRVASTNEALAALHAAIAGLPESYRAVVERYDLQEQPIEEVAAELGRSVGATYMLRARAHRALAEAMGVGAVERSP